MRTRSRPWTTLTLAALAAGTPALAGTGENALLIIDPTDPTSMWLGNYYKHARNIPDGNVLYIPPGAANYAAFVAVNLPAVAGHVANRGIAGSADYVLIAPSPVFYVDAPGLIDDQCFPISRFSISSAYTMAFLTADILSGTLTQGFPNRYFTTSNSAYRFDSETTWLTGAPSSEANARRYYLGGLIGYTGVRGNTPQEIIAMIDRGTAADGSRPTGTFYLMNNTDDPDRNVRASQFTAVERTIEQTFGGTAEVLLGKLPWGRQDCLGIVAGFPSTQLAQANIAMRPGSFAEHLTSWAATYDIADQTKLSEWIIKGVSGTSGTVEEPCNYPVKFNHSRFHVYYLQGATLGEAYLRSMQATPFQNLLLGDALVRPHAYLPQLTVTGTPAGPVSGVIQLSASAINTNPRATNIAGIDLYIDGRRHSTIANGGAFSVDTAALDDGWHDLRVVAQDNSLNRTAARWFGSMTTSNRGRSCGLAASRTSGTLADEFVFTPAPAGQAVKEVQLVQNGRVLAARGGPGPLAVHGRTLGSGPSNVHARVIFIDGKRAISPPVAVNIGTVEGTPDGRPPEAFSYTVSVLPDQPFVLTLPAAFGEPIPGATYTITTPPTKAAILGGAGSSRVLRPNAGESGLDSLSFTVQTVGGTASGVVRIVYGPYCPGDFNGDGFIDFFDYDDFVACFEGTCPPGVNADFNGDGFVDFFDFDEFAAAFEVGC